MHQAVADYLRNLLTNWGIGAQFIPALSLTLLLVIILLTAILADFITKKIIVAFIASYVKKSENTYDDVFLEKKVFSRLSHLAPAIVVFYSIHLAFAKYPGSISFIQSFLRVYMICIGLWVMDSFIDALHEIYQSFPIAKERSIKGYMQVLKIIVFSLGGIFILSVLLNKSPFTLLAGLGALAAVLILVFKDTIVGLVSSIQLSANEMLKLGDWIEIPKHNIDGTVFEISLTTVKVQNWDKTISTIPTFTLVNESFLNWRGMTDSEGRRVRRTYNIDINSIQFVDATITAELRKHPILSSFIDERVKNGQDKELTNIQLFRIYLEYKLKSDKWINPSLTLLVRLLNPTEKGLPLDVIYFLNDKDGNAYEMEQTSITEQILAALPLFRLKLFQNLSGLDLKAKN
jgi:miniconductance mechanosensitive channel